MLKVRVVTQIGRTLIGVLIFAAAFGGSIAVRDEMYERSLQANLHRIEAGMSEAEVIAILGEPTSKSISDIPGVYWCYGSSTWQRRLASDIYCGSVLSK